MSPHALESSVDFAGYVRYAVPPLTLWEAALTEDGGELETLSPFCLKVLRALRWLGFPFDRRFGKPADPVPVLLIGGEPVASSNEICRRLDALAGGGVLIPTDSWSRAEALAWEQLADTSLSRFVATARRADDRRCPRFAELLDALDVRAPRERFWVGPRLSVADVALFGQLSTLRSPTTPVHRAALAARTQLSRYIERVDRATGTALLLG